MPVDLLAVLEPVLGKRDQRFFELAVTLIPIFFLTGAVSSAARVPREKVWPRKSHFWGVFALLVFVFVEVNAELRGIEALVGGNVDDFDRSLVLVGLVLAILAAAASLVGPWVKHFYGSGPGYREIGVTLGVGGVLLLGSIGWGTYTVFDSIFELTEAEKQVQALERLSDQDLDLKEEIQLDNAERKKLLRLHIRYAHICGLLQSKPSQVEDKLAMQLVQMEILEFVFENNLVHLLGKKDKALSWLNGQPC